MKRIASVFLVLALATVQGAGSADGAKSEEDLKREAAIAEWGCLLDSTTPNP